MLRDLLNVIYTAYLYTKAFKTLRAMLISAPILAHYDLDSQYLLETNALDIVIAAVFS